MTITGGELLLDLIEGNGIEYIFCSPGTEWAPVWEGLVKRQLAGNQLVKYVNCRHEMLAVSMAQGYFEASGKMAAVLLHSGVGALSGSMAMRNAYFARAPMLIISGETYAHSQGEGVRPQGWHWLGLLSDIGGPSSLVKGYVKWTNSVRSKDGLIDLVERGCRIAQSPAPGPVFLTVSPELLAKEFPDEKLISTLNSLIRFELPSEGLERAAELLIHSQRPMILTEYAGKKPQAVAKLVKLAELLSIPVFEFFAFFGNFPKDHPLYQGYDALQPLQEADVVLVVGSTLPWYPPAACLRESVKVILLDEDSLHQNLPQWGYHIDLPLTVDIERALEALIGIIQAKTAKSQTPEALIKARFALWQTKHEKMLSDWQVETTADQNKKPIAARCLLDRLREGLPKYIFIDETIIHTRLVHRYLGNPDRYFRPTYGGLGVGFGEAIGVKLARPDEPVALIIGDGTFFYNPSLAGLGLCQEYKMPLLIVIADNGGYVAMKMGYHQLFPKGAAVTSNTYLGVDITPAPDYVKLAEAFGAYGEKVEDPADLEAAIKRASLEVKNGRTALLDVLMM